MRRSTIDTGHRMRGQWESEWEHSRGSRGAFDLQGRVADHHVLGSENVHQSSQVWPIDVVTRSSLVMIPAMILMTSILFIGGSLHAFPGKNHGDRPIGGIGVIVGLPDRRLYLVELRNKAK